MDNMEKMAYGHNYSIINEHIIRGLTLRYQFYLGDIEKYNQGIIKEKEMDFIYIENIIDSLIYYENNRDTFKNIEEYYPVIVNNIIKEHDKKIKVLNKSS